MDATALWDSNASVASLRKLGGRPRCGKPGEHLGAEWSSPVRGAQLERGSGGWFGSVFGPPKIACANASAEKEATTAVGMLTFQGRVLRVHFDEDAPPGCAAAAVVGRTRFVTRVWGDRIALPEDSTLSLSLVS